MPPGLGPGHPGDRPQVREGPRLETADLRVAEVRDGVAVGAQADQPPEGLHPSHVVEDPAFVRLQPPPRPAVLRGPTDLAAPPGPPGDHPPEPLPVPVRHTGADVGEPAGAGDQVDEEAAAEGPVLAGQQVGDIRGGRPPPEALHAGARRVPASGRRVPAGPVPLRLVLLGERNVQPDAFGRHEPPSSRSHGGTRAARQEPETVEEGRFGAAHEKPYTDQSASVR